MSTETTSIPIVQLELVAAVAGCGRLLVYPVRVGLTFQLAPHAMIRLSHTLWCWANRNTLV